MIKQTCFTVWLLVWGAVVCGQAALSVPDDDGTPDSVLRQIQKRGVLKVGVGGFYRPFSFTDFNGNIIGLEIDLAADIAKRLGVTLETVPVSPEKRTEWLLANTVDMIIDEYQKSDFAYGDDLGLIIPAYYTSGYAVFGKTDIPVTVWKELRQYKVCAVKNTPINIIAQKKYLLNLSTYDTVNEIKFHLKNNQNCDVWLYDDVYLKPLLYRPDWHGFTILLNSLDEISWFILVSPDKLNSDYSERLSEIVKQWFRSQYISSLEWKWRIPYSQYIRTMEKIHPPKKKN